MLPRFVRYAGVVAVLIVIGYFSFGGVPPQQPGSGPLWDKKLHFVAYAGLGLSIAYATIEEQRLWLRLAFIIGGATLYGAGVEAVQFVLPERYFGLGDLLANTIGACLATGWLIVERIVGYVPVGRGEVTSQ
jgi:VanZ family protein